MPLRCSLGFYSTILVVLSGACVVQSTLGAGTADPLVSGFEDPPPAAKPRVWWHWIDGNVSQRGIEEDLTWLHDVGIGGVHNFDAALGGSRDPAHLVEKRIAYLTPEWRELFRFAVERANQYGMEFTIASSPGWSESGGPWVKPAQAMKKLVWSETVIDGGRPFSGMLLAPPKETGPFQDVPFATVPFAIMTQLPEYYSDAAVTAIRLPAAEIDPLTQATVTTSAGAIDAKLLSDGDLVHGASVPYGDAPTAWIEFVYPKAQRVQSLTAAIARPPNLSPSDSTSGGAVWLESSDDGRTFKRVVDVPRNGAPEQTIGFPAVTARFFRVVLERPNPKPGPLDALFGLSAPQPSAHSILELVLHSEPRVSRFEDKAGFSNRAITEADNTPTIDPRESIPKDSVIDLTGKMRADGTLDWTPPRGRWVVLRFGYSLTGRTNHPASREGTGLEVDKLNETHVRDHFNDYFGEYEKTLGTQLIGRQGLQFMLTDSYEAGIANWTDDLPDQFRRRRGYDPLPWLPVLAGRVVDSAAASDRFLWDFRDTLGDLIADAHYTQLSTLLHARGLGRYGESHESGRAFTGDGMQVKKSADVPMGALWSSTLGQPRETFDADIRESASVAHIYGQHFVAAESLTAFGNWFAFAPETLKPYADRELAMGLNRFVIHTSVHQPDDRLGPGATLGPFGQWFTRHETWAQEARPWISYLTRSAYLLQQGRFVADIAYLYGEDNNITNLFGHGPPPIPAGYNFDYINADALIHSLSVRDGMIVAPSGMQYRALALDSSTKRMSLPVLQKIAEILEQGAIVIGPRPGSTPSLADDEKAFKTLADRIWRDDAVSRPVGKGILWSGSLATVLPQLPIPPDCQLEGAGTPSGFRFVHRQLDDGDLYFIVNGSEESRITQASVRVSGKAPEFWHADTGEIVPASYRMENGRTIVPLDMPPSDALFLVFRTPTSERARAIAAPASEIVGKVQGPWKLSFPADHGAPATAELRELSSWTDSADGGIKYFSGTATYTASFAASKAWLANGARVRIDLGSVKNLAEVRLNGQSLGIVWKKPFIVDVTKALRPGENHLEVRVTNLWPNRMIGDKQAGAKQIAFATYDPYKVDSPLLPSGLLGPVTIVRAGAH
jgi:hypothetical protein